MLKTWFGWRCPRCGRTYMDHPQRPCRGRFVGGTFREHEDAEVEKADLKIDTDGAPITIRRR